MPDLSAMQCNVTMITTTGEAIQFQLPFQFDPPLPMRSSLPTLQKRLTNVLGDLAAADLDAFHKQAIQQRLIAKLRGPQLGIKPDPNKPGLPGLESA